MGGNSQSSSGSTATTLADVLAGASLGFLDAQNGAPVTVTEPVPGTPYGPAGYSQPTPYYPSSLTNLVGGNGGLVIVGLVIVAVFLLRR